MLSIITEKENTKSRTDNGNTENVQRDKVIIFQKLEIPSNEISEMECKS